MRARTSKHEARSPRTRTGLTGLSSGPPGVAILTVFTRPKSHWWCAITRAKEIGCYRQRGRGRGCDPTSTHEGMAVLRSGMAPPRRCAQHERRGGVDRGWSEPVLPGSDRGTVLIDGSAVDLAEQKRSELRGVLQGPVVVLAAPDPVVLGDPQDLVGFGSSERTAVGDGALAGRGVIAETLQDGDGLQNRFAGLGGETAQEVVVDGDGGAGARSSIVRG